MSKTNTKLLKQLAFEYGVAPITLRRELKRAGFKKSRPGGRLYYPIDIEKIYQILGEPKSDE